MKIYKHIIFVFLLLIASSLSCEIYANHNVNMTGTHPLCDTITRISTSRKENNRLTANSLGENPPPQHQLTARDTIQNPKCRDTISCSGLSKSTRKAEKKSLPTKTIFALKSNLLYDALSLVNFSIEIPLADKFSLLYYHQFPWWRWGKANNEYCLRFLSIGGEARWWFALKPKENTDKRIRRDRLVGHFFGLYSESGRYDLQRRRDVCYQGEFWSAGLTYGYSMPIGRRMNLELSLSAGYASIPYRGYTPSEDYETLWRDYDKIGTWGYFGLTKAQVSLVIPITAKDKKGGKR